MVSEGDLTETIKAALAPEFLEVKDLSDGCGAKFNVVCVSKAFEGKALLERQRMVNAAIEKEMQSIHALTMKTWTPEQYEKKKADGAI